MQASCRLPENAAAHNLAVQYLIPDMCQALRSLAMVSHLPGTDTNRELPTLPLTLETHVTYPAHHSWF